MAICRPSNNPHLWPHDVEGVVGINWPLQSMKSYEFSLYLTCNSFIGSVILRYLQKSNSFSNASFVLPVSCKIYSCDSKICQFVQVTSLLELIASYMELNVICTVIWMLCVKCGNIWSGYLLKLIVTQFSEHFKPCTKVH